VTVFVMWPYVWEQIKEDEPPLIHTLLWQHCNIIILRMGALIGIRALINKNTFEGGCLFERECLLKGQR